MLSILSESGDSTQAVPGISRRFKNWTFGCPLPQRCTLAEPGQGIEESVGAKRRNRDVPGNEKHSVWL